MYILWFLIFVFLWDICLCPCDYMCFLNFSFGSFSFVRFLFCPILICFYLVYFSSLLIFLDAHLYPDKRKKECGFRWMGKQGIWGGLEEGRPLITIYCIKINFHTKEKEGSLWLIEVGY